ncbi:MAG: diadenylate cyclase CdaA [Ignavibacteriaceae bacterium]|jgi:diadenylate cyclase|nr:diadenylate cyclase CdaA [Ignavibacteriaceae bacterium]
MFEIFKIGFLTVNFTDLIDIIIVSFIIYELYRLLKGTIAAQIFIGLCIILILSFISQVANFRALSALLKLVTDIWVIAFLILFQPEIRRLLVFVAQNPIFRIFVKHESNEAAEIITEASFELAQQQHGALIILCKTTGIRSFAETGEQINARLSKDLLRTIFFPRSPLHDGAVVISGNLIEAARCTLPLSANTFVNGEALGMRHRAGLGISELTDVISIIVSEETGGISIAENGHMIRELSRDALKKKLTRAIKSPNTKGLRRIMDALYR